MTDQNAVRARPGRSPTSAPGLHAGETLFGAFAGLGSPIAAEMLARAGFDWLIIDLEHGAGTESDLLASLHAIGDDADRGAGPAAIRRAPADRTCARPRRARAHDPARRRPRAGARGDLVHALPAGRHARARPVARAGQVSASVGHADIRAINAHDPRDHPDRVAERGRARRRDRRASTASTSCSSDRPTCRTASGSPAGSTTRPTSTRCDTSSRRAETPRARRRDPAARRVVTAAPPRARVPVHRARLGRGVHRRWRAGHRVRHTRLTGAGGLPPVASPQPSTSASSGVAGSGAPRGRGAVWAMITPTRMSPRPEQLDRRKALIRGSRTRGRREDRFDRADQRRLRRPDPPSPGVERLDGQERGEEADPEQVEPGRRSGSSAGSSGSPATSGHHGRTRRPSRSSSPPSCLRRPWPPGRPRACRSRAGRAARPTGARTGRSRPSRSTAEARIRRMPCERQVRRRVDAAEREHDADHREDEREPRPPARQPRGEPKRQHGTKAG